jgi:hypothetical protein
MSPSKKKKKKSKTHQAYLFSLSNIWDFCSDSQRLDSEKAKRKRRLENDSSFGSCGVTRAFSFCSTVERMDGTIYR